MSEVKNSIPKKPVVAVLHNIRSAYNVGSMFRTAEGLGVEHLYLGGYTPAPDQHQTICKTALGAENFVSWEKFWHTGKLLKKLKQTGYKIVAVELAAKSQPLVNFQPSFPLVFVVGNEVLGLSKKILALADDVVEIPMLGKKESFNVSVSFALAAYEIQRNNLLYRNFKEFACPASPLA